MPDFQPEVGCFDHDQISNALITDNDKKISSVSEPKVNVDRKHILVIETNESAKNVLLDQLLQIVDCFSLPPKIIFDIL